MSTKWGIAGAGKISSDFVTAMKNLPKGDHELVAVGARSLKNAQEFAKKHGCQKAYGSYKEIAEDPDIKVVYIGVIHPYHLDVASMMLNAGKHCLVEKPLCINVKETKQLINLAREKKLFMMEAIWTRCFPLYGEMIGRVKSGEIGDVVWASASFGVPISSVPRISQKELGGGTTLDLGVYAVQFVSLVMGGEKPISVKADGHLNENGVDSTVNATLKYSNGRMATISSSCMTQLPNEGLICGTKGTIKVESPVWAPEQLQSPSGKFSDIFKDNKEKYNFVNSEGLKFEAAEVRRCLNEGLLESPKLTLDETLLIAEIMETIRKSAGTSYPQD